MSRDLMFRDEIRDLVTAAYDELEEPDAGPATELYDEADITRLPERARRWVFGVGAPVAHAELEPGEEVADLGSGAGIDTMLAAMAIGPEGRVVGVDLLDSMVERARGFAADAGLANAEFVTGEMEDLPLADRSVDVVISNGAINLSARKSRVLAEAFRVLRPGGRLVVSDLTIREEELPSEVLTHPSAWAG
jgi:arsenite methyltransferase